MTRRNARIKLHPCDILDISKPMPLLRVIDNEWHCVNLNAKGVYITYTADPIKPRTVTDLVRLDELFSWLEDNVEWDEGSHQERKIRARGLSE